jgi:hypothetical protein
VFTTWLRKTTGWAIADHPAKLAGPYARLEQLLKLFWRYKANTQHAVRDGDMKYLKILDNTFLFNVVEDPMERANLKQRMPDTYNRLVREWSAWNATMLPETDASFTFNFTGAELAGHIGTPEASHKADNPPPTVPHP